jgi:hypothetical protein
MKYIHRFIIILVSIGVYQCAEKKDNSPVAADTSDMAEESLSVPARKWVVDRVEKAEERLSRNRAGQLLWNSMETHGGLSTWYENGPLYFRFDYKNLETGGPDTYQTIDTWSARARHQLASEPGIEYGWDGKKAWKHPADAEIEENPRFWALTPYYFVGVPFVLADEGIQLAYEGEISFEGNTYHQVRVTFGEGMGDAPDDFYVLYLDTETSRVGGLRYVVSYPGFYEEGQHSEEKHMTYYGTQTVGGIVFPKTIKTYAWDGKQPGELMVNISITDIDFKPDTPAEYFNIPDGSRVMEGYVFE